MVRSPSKVAVNFAPGGDLGSLGGRGLAAAGPAPRAQAATRAASRAMAIRFMARTLRRARCPLLAARLRSGTTTAPPKQGRRCRADDGIRTHDLRHGKATL